MRRVLKLIASPTPELLDRIMLAVAQNELWEKRRQQPVEILKEHHKNGARIIIISAAYQPAVQKFAGLIGEERTIGIGTAIRIENDKVCLAEQITSRENKLKKLKDQIGAEQVDLALGDTFADIPLLEDAKEAIAVYPDQKLLAAARQNNWQVISS